MKVHAPDMAFRGTRTYLHSTDLYEAILAGCEVTDLGTADGRLFLKIRKTLTCQPELCFLAPGETGDPAGAGADFIVTVGGYPVAGFVRETGRPVTRRKEYDERSIWDCASVSGMTITVRKPSLAAPIEVVTALGVLQHRTVYPPKDGSRWMLGRIDLARPLRHADVAALEIMLRQHIGQRMTRSTIAAAGVTLGTMEFLLTPS